MNRRIFLKLLGLSPVVPSVLCAREKPELTTKSLRKFVDDNPKMFQTPDLQPYQKAFLEQNSIADTKRTGAEFICKARCNCIEQQLTGINDRVMVICPNHAPYWVNDDGTTEDLVLTEFDN